MKSWSLLKRKLEQLQKDLEPKNKTLDTAMRIQTDQDFSQNEIKKLDKIYNIDKINTATREDKEFAAEQKIREFKKMLSRLKALQKRIAHKQ